MLYKFIILGLVCILMVTPVMAAKQDTGFDVYLDQYGIDLISYDVSDKFSYKETDNEEKFIILEINVIMPNEEEKFLYWIMPKDKYNERREKV